MGPHRRVVLSSLIMVFILVLSGCSFRIDFKGRLILLNSSGGPISSVKLGLLTQGTNWKLDRLDLSNGEGWLRDFRNDPVTMNDREVIQISWVDRSGVAQSQKLPFATEIENFPDADFLIEIGEKGEVHATNYGSSLLRARHDFYKVRKTLAGCRGQAP